MKKKFQKVNKFEISFKLSIFKENIIAITIEIIISDKVGKINFTLLTNSRKPNH